MHLVKLGLIAIGAFLLPPAHADVWEYRGDGSVVFHQSLDHFQRQRMSAQWQPPSAATLGRRRADFDAIIREHAATHNVDADLVRAIIEVESGYDAKAVSKAGALGLMQLMPATAERFSVRDAFNATENIAAGVQYLKILSNEFKDLELVLAAYNAGEVAVRNYDNQVPPYPETREYVDRVLLLLGQKVADEGSLTQQ